VKSPHRLHALQCNSRAIGTHVHLLHRVDVLRIVVHDDADVYTCVVKMLTIASSWRHLCIYIRAQVTPAYEHMRLTCTYRSVSSLRENFMCSTQCIAQRPPCSPVARTRRDTHISCKFLTHTCSYTHTTSYRSLVQHRA